MKLSTFITNIYFEEDVSLNRFTKFCNTWSNRFLTPARYLLNGRCVCCIVVPYDQEDNLVLFQDLSSPSFVAFPKFFKTALAIILFIPSVCLGGVPNFGMMFVSTKLRARHIAWEQNLVNQDPTCLDSKCIDVAIGLYKNTLQRLFRDLRALTPEQLDDFIDYFSTAGKYLAPENGAQPYLTRNLAFLDENYPYLFPSDRQGKEAHQLDCVIGCFLKYFIQNELSEADFFDCLDLLNFHAKPMSIDDTLMSFEWVSCIQQCMDFEQPLQKRMEAFEQYLEDNNCVFKKSNIGAPVLESPESLTPISTLSSEQKKQHCLPDHKEQQYNRHIFHLKDNELESKSDCSKCYKTL